MQGIGNLFAEKNDDMYNSVRYDVDDMSTLKETVENKILCSCGNNYVQVITIFLLKTLRLL